jgi:Flp pilus assembly pilin Flp
MTLVAIAVVASVMLLGRATGSLFSTANSSVSAIAP